jgi:hypothetical protein
MAQQTLNIPDDSPATRNAQPPADDRAPDPIPEGKLYTVQGFRKDGTRFEGKNEDKPVAHADAVKACRAANASAGAQSGAVWFGVVVAASEVGK